jgi:hypothetical protein
MEDHKTSLSAFCNVIKSKLPPDRSRTLDKYGNRKTTTKYIHTRSDTENSPRPGCFSQFYRELAASALSTHNQTDFYNPRKRANITLFSSSSLAFYSTSDFCYSFVASLSFKYIHHSYYSWRSHNAILVAICLTAPYL